MYIKDNLSDEANGEDEQDGVVGCRILQEQGGGCGEHDPNNAADSGPNGEDGADVFVFRFAFLDPAK